MAADTPPDGPCTTAVLPLFLASLGLGCSAFGGPIAHIGYFRHAYVEKRGWIDASTFAGIVALCQALPGPTSSQVGFLVGWHRAGWRGAVAAWLGFTLPAALLMTGLALAAPHWRGEVPGAVLHGLTLAAVAVVAQAVWSMARALCSDLPRVLIALTAGTGVLAISSPVAQLVVLGAAAIVGTLCLTAAQSATRPAPVSAVPQSLAVGALGVFAVLLLAATLLLAVPSRGLVALAGMFYRVGASVFGGGHVVLPLLRDSLVPQGWMTDATFLAGYGAAQALPGPLFAFSAYVGASVAPAGAALTWALTALMAIFLPGLLLAMAGAALWGRLVRWPRAYAALAGINAAVVGVLAAALYDPLVTTGVRGLADAMVCAVALWLLQVRRAAPLPVVGGCVAAALVGGLQGV